MPDHRDMAEMSTAPIREPAEAIALPAIVDLVASSAGEVADRARAALDAVLPHDALILIAPSSPGLPVQIAAPRGMRERLSAVAWDDVLGDLTAIARTGDAVRLALPDVVAGLRVAGWAVAAAGAPMALIVGSQNALALDRAREAAAMQIATLAAARTRAIREDPSPGTLAFSHAINQERERMRWELQTSHTATLTTLLQLLRRAARRDRAETSGRGTDPAIAEAIDFASRALLDMKRAADRDDASLNVGLEEEFRRAEEEVRRILRRSGLELIAGLSAPDEAHVPWAIAQAAGAATRAGALQAVRNTGADKLRVHWELIDDELVIVISDNGVGGATGRDSGEPDLALMRRRIVALRGSVEVEAVPKWGTSVTCRLPLHEVATAPDSPATQRIAELRAREREVLELIVAGLRNREIADRLFITVRTVKFHVSNILRRLEVQSRTEAIALAHSAGISPQATAPTAKELPA
jgi:DNA-binding CsgD family transcriptional regulator/signal transduction histidine kinase